MQLRHVPNIDIKYWSALVLASIFGANTGDFFAGGESEDRPVGKPIGDKVRLPNGKRPGGSGEDWEMDNETIEDAGYQRRKNDDDDDN